MKKLLKTLSFFIMTTLIICALFSMMRFLGIALLLEVPSGKDFLMDIKINLIVSAVMAFYVSIKEIDKNTF